MLITPKSSLALKMMQDGSSIMPKCCKVDPNGCLSLSDILATFAVAINEDQAWALTYQTLQAAKVVRKDLSSRESFFLASHPDHIKIHSDGSVHSDTFLNPNLILNNNNRTERSVAECKIISKLGEVIFTALDYGFSDEDERELSPEINSLLDAMISADDSTERSENDDEGIERDSGDSDDDQSGRGGGARIDNILGMCRSRLGRGSDNNSSDAHYKAVCRALVTEALELSEFLDRVSQGAKELKRPAGHNSNSGRNTASPNLIQRELFDLEQLNFAVWARLWVQVIKKLRDGVKLRETQNLSSRGVRPPKEYELTPYEILMDDIRSRRYKLKQVMVDGELPPKIKEDAHAKILDFIRSRPPLKNGANRKLGPPPVKKLHPIEALMESIKQPHHLKPTPTKVSNSLPKVSIKSTRRQSCYGEISRAPCQKTMAVRNSSSFSAGQSLSSEARPKRLIIPDFDRLYSLDKDDDSDEENGYGGANQSTDSTGSLYYGHIFPDVTQSPNAWDTVNESNAAENGDVSCLSSRVDLKRRHTVCSPNLAKSNNNNSKFSFERVNNVAAFHSLNDSNVPPVFQKQKTKDTRCMIT